MGSQGLMAWKKLEAVWMGNIPSLAASWSTMMIITTSRPGLSSTITTSVMSDIKASEAR